jgi:hypothetical protein
MRSIVILIISVSLILILSPTALAIGSVKSIEVHAEVHPPKLFPGDTADCKLILYNPNWDSIKVSYVSFDAPSGISVKMPIIFEIGWIPGNSTYELPFTVKAVKPGTYTLKCKVNVENITITKLVKIKVEERYPRLIPVSSLKLGEVSELDLVLETPILIKKVVVEPLFSAEPSQVYFEGVNGSARLSFKCYINKTEKLAFRISFYNGDNFHTIRQEVSPIYRESWGVIVNMTSPLKEVYLSDVVPVFLKITNARADRIHNIKIHIISNGTLLEKDVEIPYLEPNTGEVIVFKYSPPKDRLEDKLIAKIEYEDSMDNRYQISKSISIKVIPEYTLTLTNIDVKDGKVSGDVGNQGYETVYSVLLHVSSEKGEKDYFIGKISPSDIQEFEVKLSGNKIHLTVTWANELGEKFNFTKEVYVGESIQFIQIGCVVFGLVVVVVIIGVLYLRRRREV